MVKLVKFSPVPLVALLLMALWVQGVFADGNVDQRNDEINGLFSHNINAANGQQFTPAKSPLTGVDLHLTFVFPQPGENITIKIREGTDGSPANLNSPVIASSSHPIPELASGEVVAEGFFHFGFPSHIAVVAEHSYLLEVVAEQGSLHFMNATADDKYPTRGSAIINGNVAEEFDFLFRTYFSQAPRDLKIEALADLKGLVGSNEHSQKELDKAIDHLDKSLAHELWVADDHLVEQDGKKVFGEEKKAVKHLMKILKVNGKAYDPGNVADTVSKVIERLVNADRVLAEIALNDARNTPVNDQTEEKIAKEIEKAEKELAKAQEELDKGRADHAIKKYKKAWEHAQHAIKHANE